MDFWLIEAGKSIAKPFYEKAIKKCVLVTDQEGNEKFSGVRTALTISIALNLLIAFTIYRNWSSIGWTFDSDSIGLNPASTRNLAGVIERVTNPDGDDTFYSVLESLCRILARARPGREELRASFAWYDPNDKRLYVKQGYGWSQPIARAIFFEPDPDGDDEAAKKVRRGISGYVFRNNQLVRISDVSELNSNSPYFYKLLDSSIQEIDKSMLCVPVGPAFRSMNEKRQPAGVLTVTSSTKGQFDERDERICKLFASLAYCAFELERCRNQSSDTSSVSAQHESSTENP